MNPERTQLLEQVAAGQVSAVEAAQRLGTDVSTAGRWLHVRVTDLATGFQRVQVNLPLVWVDAAMKLGARYQPHLGGLDLDWNEIVTMLKADPSSGRLVEVEDLEDNQRVEIYID